MAVETGSDTLLWQAIAGAFGVLASVFGYFIKQRDQKIDENTKVVANLREEVIVLKTHLEAFSAEQAEMKESLRGLVDCVQDIRIYLASLPCNDHKRCTVHVEKYPPNSFTSN